MPGDSSFRTVRGWDFGLCLFGLGLQESEMKVFKLMLVSLAGLENKIIEPEFARTSEGSVGCRRRLGGMHRYYYREAARSRR